MRQICDYSECTGCLACYNNCPVGAISIIENKKYGFVPIIDSKKCVRCGKCIRTCSTINPISLNSIFEVYAVWSNNNKVLRESSSGGAAYEIAKRVLELNGVIYGAAFNGEFKVQHIRISQIKNLNKLQGSKYVQSNLNLVYKRIKQDVLNGRLVCFFGTGCQVAGVKTFLGDNLAEKVLFVDLVCHGTPPAKCFNQYIDSIVLRNTIDSISFRNDNKMRICITSKGKKVYSKPFYRDAYYLAFELGINLRESCYHCKYANSSRSGDITLGDFHSVNRKGAIAHTVQHGTSMVCINTPKGKSFFDGLKNRVCYESYSIVEALKFNPQLSSPSMKHKLRNAYLRKSGRNSFMELNKTMRYLLVKYTIKNSIAQMVSIRIGRKK